MMFGRTAGRLSGEDGFTLAELLVFLVIMIVLLIGIGGMLSSGAKSSVASYSLTRMENAANEAVVSMTRQIRVATRIDPASSAQAITFSGYLDGGTLSTVALAVQDRAMTRNGSVWIEGVESMDITYFDENGDLLTPGTPGWNLQVHRVDFKLVFAADALGISFSRTYGGTVALRNDLDQA